MILLVFPITDSCVTPVVFMTSLRLMLRINFINPLLSKTSNFRNFIKFEFLKFMIDLLKKSVCLGKEQTLVQWW